MARQIPDCRSQTDTGGPAIPQALLTRATWRHRQLPGDDTDLVADMAAFEDLQRFPPPFVTTPVMQARILGARLTAGREV